MLEWYHYLLFAGVAVSLFFSVLYSIRHRRQTDPLLKGLFQARMNIAMGALLLTLAFAQLFLYEMTATRRVIGVVFFLIGVFNVFAGLRNHAYFSRRRSG